MSDRQDKISKMVRGLVAEYIDRESKSTNLITVTNVEVSPDAKYGKIFITVLPIKDEEKAIEFLKRKRKDIHEYLKKNMRTRPIPFIDVMIDVGEKHRQRIDELSVGL